MKMIFGRLVIGLGLGTSMLSGGAAFAVTPEQIEAIRNQPMLDPSKQQDILQQQQKLQQKADKKTVEEGEKDQNDKATKGPTFTLKAIRFSESVYLTSDDLRKVVGPLLNTQVSFTDLQNLKTKIIELYHAKGVYTATAVLPQQKIKDGVVFMRLVEGSLGELTVEDHTYTDEAFIRGWLRNDEQVSAIDIKALESDVLVFNRINDQRLQAELHAGEQFGLTDIVIRVQEPARNQGYLFWDNYGAPASGKNELGAMYVRQKLWLDGDRLTVHALHSGNTNLDFKKDLDFIRNETGIMSLNLGYNLPLAQTGWRLGTTISSTQSDIINGEFNDIGIRGKSDRVSVDASWLAYSELYQWVDVIAGADHTWSESDVVDSAKISELKIAQYYGGAQLNWLSNLWQLSLRQMIYYAYVDDQLNPDDQDVFLAKGDVNFIAQYPKYNVYGLVKGQWQNATENGLVGSLSYSLGGPTNVRGYEPGYVSGDEGYFWSIESHWNGLTWQGYHFDFSIFHDQGVVTSANPTEKLVSLGTGLSISGGPYVSFDFTAAESHKKINPDQSDWVVYGRLTCQCW